MAIKWIRRWFWSEIESWENCEIALSDNNINLIKKQLGGKIKMRVPYKYLRPLFLNFI